jgi:ferritin-like metal-binding protein YciE
MSILPRRGYCVGGVAPSTFCFSTMPHEQIITWLRDAHAMETSLDQVLIRHIAAAADHPDVQARLEQHRAETRQHAEQVAEALQELGASVSAVKSTAASFMGAMEGMSTAVFRDELVKNALADYAVEHFEIGCYSALVAAAEDAGLDELARTCSGILRSEVEMANWLEDQIPALTRAFLHESLRAG